jgi:SH3 domain protein
MRSACRYVFVLLVLALVGPSGAAHITDKLVIGLYAQAGTEAAPIRLLSTGMSLEVLEREGEFVEVRLADGVKGWVEARYVTEEKPAKAILLETQTRLRALDARLRALKERGVSGDGTAAGSAVPNLAPSARETQLRQALGTAEARIVALEQELQEQPIEAAAQQQLKALQAQTQVALQVLADARGMQLVKAGPAVGQGLLSRYRIWIVGVAAMVLGFGIGVALVDYRIRKRYSGSRI